jgi:hypothetical protein
MKYTEQDLRKAFRAGTVCGSHLSYYDTPENEDEYINSLNESVVEEDKIPLTYCFLRRKIDWEQFCDLTGVNYYAKANGYEIKNDEVFYITESKAKQFNLI